jgi:hypothetical protein
LNRQSEISSQPFKFASFLWREFIGTELDLDLPERTGEFEQHLRAVLVDDWRSGVPTDVETLIEREFAERSGVFGATLAHFIAIHRERS